MTLGATYDTAERLLKLDQGRFQRLGDQLLRTLDPRLVGLVPNGINEKDRTTTGNPDSYIGQNAKKCVVAVEYTVQSSNIPAKFRKDFETVAKECAEAQLVVLVAAVSIAGLDFNDLQRLAEDARVELLLVGAEALVLALDDVRQDLRAEFLNIPIESHSIESFRGSLRIATERSVAAHVEDRAQIPRADVLRNLNTKLLAGQLVLLTGPIGVGKSTFTSRFARERSHVAPTLWLKARELNWTTADPIGEEVARVAYGAAVPERIVTLWRLLVFTESELIIVLDGADEVHDYHQLARGVNTFLKSAPQGTKLVASCRDSALRLVQPQFVHVGWQNIPLVELSEPTEYVLDKWLPHVGATPTEVRELKRKMSKSIKRRPLFLLLALELLRDGSVDSQDVGAAVVTSFSKRISDRLRSDGSGPTIQEVRESLSSLAWECLSADGRARAKKLRGVNSDWRGDGEQTLLGAATSVGLISIDDAEVVRFAHSYLEGCFAAAGEPDWDWFVSSVPLTASTLRGVARAVGDPNSLVRHLLENEDPRAFNVGASVANRLDGDVCAHLSVLCRELLNSDFDSDVAGALELLKNTNSDEARELATTWWNDLPDVGRRRWCIEAADLFLQLGVDAWPIIKRHRDLVKWDMPWIDPVFVRQLRELSAEFRSKLMEAAWGDVKDGHTDHSALKLLSVARDLRVVDLLREKQKQQGTLDRHEHRLLIFLNTDESMDVYAASVEEHLSHVPELESREIRQDGSATLALFSTVVLKQADIGYYPNEALVNVVQAALSSPNPVHRRFGRAWLGTVATETLFVTAAESAEVGWGIWMLDSLETALTRVPIERLEQLFTSVNRIGKAAIVRALGFAPGLNAEPFLVSCLKHDVQSVRSSAAQSLGRLNAISAVPALNEIVATDHVSESVLEACAQAIGVLRHRSSVGPLLIALDRAVRNDSAAVQVVRALASFGEIASDKLLERWNKIHAKATIVWAWTQLPCLEPMKSLLRDDPDLIELVVAALHIRRGHLLPGYSFSGEDSYQSYIEDEELYEAVSEYINAAQFSGESLKPYARAIACFNLPQAHARLLEWAQADPPVSTSEEAAWILALRGIEPFVSGAVANELDRVSQRFPFTDRLHQWPRELVRAQIRQRLQNTPTATLVDIFAEFAEPDDDELFLELEKHADKNIANSAHYHLHWK